MDRETILTRAIRRIVEEYRPLRVLLFGSQAWGEPDDDSDFDLLVVVPDDADTARLAVEIRLRLKDLPAAFDIVVRRRSPWEKWSRVPITLEHRIAQQGRVVHDVAA